MKGLVKGSLFSVILILIISGIAAVVNMKLTVPHSVLKGILWVISGICVFAGVLPVTKSADSNKFLKGIGCSFITVIMLLVIVSIAGKALPSTGGFYAYSLICMLCGLLGAIVGINI